MTVVIFLTGCDQVSNQISGLFTKPSVEKTISRMSALSKEGKQEKAIEAGEAFVGKYSDPDNQVREQLVRLYLEKGSTSDALRHMQGFNSGKSLTDTEVAPLGPKVGAPAVSNIPSNVNSPHSGSIAVDGASVRTGPSGTEVRAGDAVVRINKER